METAERILSTVVGALLWALHWLWIGLQALWGLVVSAYNMAFDYESYMSVEPLITINAVGVAMAMFAMEQLLEKAKDPPAETREEVRRRRREQFAMNVTVWAGMCHLVSIFMALTVRSTDNHPNLTAFGPWLAGATNWTVIGTLLVMLAMGWVFVEMLIVNDSSAARAPSLTKAGAKLPV